MMRKDRNHDLARGMGYLVLVAWIVLWLGIPLTSGASNDEGASRVSDMSPARWGDAGLAEAAVLDAASWDHPPILAEGRQGVVATTSMGGTAARAGLEALRRGGSAVDAALVTALTQTVLNAGCWTSFAGLMSMVIYDAESGEIFTLEGGWNTVRGESYPLPPATREKASGRGVLVPGFMAAVQAAHDRFGVLPFEELFVPAVYFAEEGFEIGGHLGFLINHRRDILTRHATGREIFLRPDGELYGRGDHFRQPQLAAFLRAVATDGADVMYRGAWADKLVGTVRGARGRLRHEDLRAYRATWRPATRGAFHGHEIAGLGLPSAGGLEMVESFRLVERLDLDPARHYSEDAETLYRLIQIPRLFHLFAAGPSADLVTRLFGPLDFSAWGRWNEATTRAIGERMEAEDWQEALRAALAGPTAVPQEHSDGVVTADRRGNVVALFHSINTGAWGSLGLFVDGVSISDAGNYPRNARAGSGHRIPHAGRPFLVLKDGKPVAASSSVGRALHGKAMQNVINMVVYGLDPQASLQKPQFFGPEYDLDEAGRPPVYKQRVPEGVFPEDVLEQLREMGQEIVLRPADDRVGVGLWAGLKIDSETGQIQASATPGGHAVGF